MANWVMYASCSTALTAAFLLHTYRTVSNEDEMLSSILRNKLHVLVLVNMAYTLLFLLGEYSRRVPSAERFLCELTSIAGKITQKLFFGSLRENESSKLSDRLVHFILTKIVFIGAILEPRLEVM